MPDRGSRSRLIQLYGVGLDVRIQDADRLLARTDGVSAAFIKELMRRAPLLAAESQPDGDGLIVTDQELELALDEMLETGGSLGRSLVGASPGLTGPEAGAGLPPHVQSGPPRRRWNHARRNRHPMIRRAADHAGPDCPSLGRSTRFSSAVPRA